MLIREPRHTELMMAFVIVAFILVIGPLAVVAGADSRYDEVARRRRLGSR